MTSREPVRGRFARITSGADAIEIKATVPGRQIDAALKRYKLTTRNDDDRLIYFFDTPDRRLLEAGIILRARRVIGGEHDSTVKFRPVDVAEVGRGWYRYPDFKIEVDASEKGFVKSASFSMPVQKGEIRRVASGRRPVARLFKASQEKFLRGMSKQRIDFARLQVMGPLRAQRWDFEDPACPWPITAELWRREDGEQLMELSVKAASRQAAAVMAGFLAFLSEVGAQRDTRQLAKTRWALDYYAARNRRAMRGSVKSATAVRNRRRGA